MASSALIIRLPAAVICIAISVAGATAEESEQRVLKAADGSVLKLNEESRMEYESWSGGHMCYLAGRLLDTPRTRRTRELLFVHDDDSDCKGSLQFQGSMAETAIFYTNGRCEQLCGNRNPPPISPLTFR